MDGGGRFLRSVTARLFAPLALARPLGPSFAFAPSAPLDAPFPDPNSARGSEAPRAAPTWANRQIHPLARTGVGSFALLFAFCVTIALGLVHSGAYAEFVAHNGAPHETLARLFGFPIESVTISGQVRLRENEILAATGVDAHSSLLFLDASETRRKLMELPLVQSARVLKLYPNRLVVAIEERQPAALWQRDGRIKVISADGTPIADLNDPRFLGLPFVVGPGAEKRLPEYAALLRDLGDLAPRVRAGALVSGRRWSLIMTNGVEVKLPEVDPGAAVGVLLRAQRETRILDKDIRSIDLRLADRIAVRLTEQGAETRENAAKRKAPKSGAHT
jgi:cell division protein FtsQ